MERYPVLGGVRALLSFGGWAVVIIAVITVVLGIGGLNQNNQLAATQGWIQIISGALLAVSGLVAVAIAEAISVIVNIEVNTRGRTQQAAIPMVGTSSSSDRGADPKGSGSDTTTELARQPTSLRAPSNADDDERQDGDLVKELEGFGYQVVQQGQLRFARRVGGGIRHNIYSRGDLLLLVERERAQSKPN